MRDPYETLGLQRGATDAEIREAFRRLARQHHPDRNPDDPQAKLRFQELNAAFQILSDPQRRARFDQLGDTSRDNGAPASQGFQGLEDLFNDLFSGFVAPRAERGDLQHVVDLTFQEAALGCTKAFRYKRADHCGVCRGSGADGEARLTTCSTCGGSGQVQLGAIGIFTFAGGRPCPRCASRGRIPDRPCEKCQGSGLSVRTREIEVRVPQGIESGASQIVRGAGSRATVGQPPGDLELVIRVRAHPHFAREGDDVFSELSIPFTTAALGGSVQAETIDGLTELAIAPGTQHDTQVKLKGHGIPHRFRGGRGDHYFNVKVQVPRLDSTRARELVREFEQVAGDEAGLLDRVKNWFAG